MSDIDALQGRIMAALDRIGQGLDSLESDDDGGSAEEIQALQQQLEDEKLANAQLEERVKQLSARTKAAEEAAEAASADQVKSDEDQSQHAETVQKLDADLQALRLANQQLRDNNAALREANTTGVVEPHLINKAMMSELEGLRASNAADRAEVDLVLAELDEVVKKAAEADQSEKEEV